MADHNTPDPTLRLYTAEQAADLLQVSPSWLRKKASARQIPSTFVGRHLRFSTADLATILRIGTRPASSTDHALTRESQP